MQVVAPLSRFAAPHALHEFDRLRPAQRRLDLVRQGLCLRDVPLRQQAGVHHRVVALDMHHRALAQPVDQRVAIGCVEHVVKGVETVPFALAGRDHQQRQVVVAEHRDGSVAQIAHEAQRFERFRASIDQIADKPQAIAPAIEAAMFKQRFEWIETALQITDRVGAHAC